MRSAQSGLSRMNKYILLLILLLAATLRIVGLKDFPTGFYCDEASIGYNAFKILHTGKDEHGIAFPLYFEAFGEYKNPVYIYCTVPFIALFGLDEFSTRLTAAFFGVLTVLFAFLLFREMFSIREGILAALLLAICNWHIHFSRIAFELISLPCFFTAGLYFLYRGTVNKTVCLYPAALILGLSMYTYGTAKVFMPLFLMGYLILFFRYFWRKKLATLLSLCIFAGTVYPLVWYSMKYPQRARARFDVMSVFSQHRSREATARLIADNYKKHFSYNFLFKNGDPNRRHAVAGFGELYRADIPLYLLGILVLIFARRREGFMLLWWLALFPAAAAITQEIPSATRCIIALPVVPGIAAVGLAWVFRNLVASRRILLVLAGMAAVIAYVYKISGEFGDYHRNYYLKYPAYAAEGIYGFQYGYRDIILYMLSQADWYDRLLITSASANRPDIFVAFYTAEAHGEAEAGKFSIFIAEEYGRYSMSDRILYALWPPELAYFLDYTIKRDIIAPGGEEPFVAAEVRKRKDYIMDWLVLGLFDNANGIGERKEFIDRKDISPDVKYQGKYGPVQWQKGPRSFVHINLNSFFAGSDHSNPGNPENVCAYALTYANSPQKRDAILELTASGEKVEAWLNGGRVTKGSVLIGDQPSKFKMVLNEGNNELLLKICERGGNWFFSARISDPEGKQFDDVRMSTDMEGYKHGVIQEVSEQGEEGEVKEQGEVVQRKEPPPVKSPPPISGHGPGLIAEYFTGMELVGEPVRVKVEDAIGFEYAKDEEKPMPPPFSIRWTGKISIESGGVYQFATESDDGSRLFIDDTLVVDSWGEHGKEYRSGAIKLSKGTHRIIIEYFDAKWSAVMRVLWTIPHDVEKEIPASALSH